MHQLASLVFVSLCLTLAGCAGLSQSLQGLKESLNQSVADEAVAESSNLIQPKSHNGWFQGAQALEPVSDGRWVHARDQAMIEIVCGHVRRWDRPGVNLESLSPLQGDPFLVPDPNQLVSSQTWFWVVSVTDDGPRVAQSRYQKIKTDDGGYRIVERWEIRDLNYSAMNEYVFTAAGIPIEVRQAIHPGLPRVQLSQNGSIECRR